MPKAKRHMHNLLISDLHGRDTDNEVFWDGVLHRLRGMQSIMQYPDCIPAPEAFIEELKPYFETNGVYTLLKAPHLMVTLQLGRARAKNALVTHAVTENIRVMIPDYAWSLRIQPKMDLSE